VARKEVSVPENTSAWTTRGPTQWPIVPTAMTVTTLVEIETCPRRWALGAASYPDIWPGLGYPQSIQRNSLEGTVVHLALRRITRELARAGSVSIHDPTSVQAMKHLGGYTEVLHECIDQVLERFATNPRAIRMQEFAGRSLRNLVGELRTQTQMILSRVRLPRVSSVTEREGTGPGGRGPLPNGTFAEIELRASRIAWKGKADLLVLSGDMCEITDFKTGAKSDGHEFQIRVYALLWSRDIDLNPQGRLADRLLLTYTDDVVEIPAPAASELDLLEHEIVARTGAARDAVSRPIPEARPHPDTCFHCTVRHLCSEYWTADAQRQMAAQTRNPQFADIEILIIGRHGPTTWDATAQCCSTVRRGASLLLRADNPPFALRAGQRIRLLSVHMTAPEEQSSEAPLIATVGALSEAFLVAE